MNLAHSASRRVGSFLASAVFILAGCQTPLERDVPKPSTKEIVGQIGPNRYYTPANQVLTPAGLPADAPIDQRVMAVAAAARQAAKDPAVDPARIYLAGRLNAAAGVFYAISRTPDVWAAGLALGGIYNHFTSKEAIFSDLIIAKHPFHEILPLLQAAPGETVEEFVRNAAKSMVGELGRRPDFVKFLFVELVEFNGRDLPHMFQAVFPQIAPLIQRFQTSRGELRQIPPFVLFRAFLGLFFSFYMTEYLLAGTPAAEMQENALDHFVDIFLHGILLSSQ